MTAALAKPTSTVTKPATTAETERSRTSDIEKDPAHYSNGSAPGRRGSGTLPGCARPPVAARADPLVVFLSLTAVFFLVRLGGDPVLLFPAHGIQAKDLKRVPQRLGFNDPLAVQYGRFMGRALARRLRRVAALQERRAAARAGAPARDAVARAGRAAAHLLRGGPCRVLIGGARGSLFDLLA